MSQVEWSNLGLDDLDEITRYISKGSPHFARDFAERIFDRTDKLSEFPLSGRAVPEAKDRSIREVIVQHYRVIYRVEPNRVLVLAVMHGSRDLAGMEQKPWNNA